MPTPARTRATRSCSSAWRRRSASTGRCKRAPNHAFESLECLGGAGYVEESGMPRLYREAPLASIWEGSGNVMSLDVLRALTRSPRSLEVFFDEVEQAQRRRRPPRCARVASLKGQFADPQTLESRARRVVEGDGAVPAGLAARAPRAGRRRRRLLRLAARRRRRPGVRHAARRAATSRRSSRARAPTPERACDPAAPPWAYHLKCAASRRTSSSRASSASASASASAGSSSCSS